MNKVCSDGPWTTTLYLSRMLSSFCLGIDPLIWRQARLDNPDPDRFIPVTMVGFHELERRRQRQEEETKLHQQRLDVGVDSLECYVYKCLCDFVCKDVFVLKFVLEYLCSM